MQDYVQTLEDTVKEFIKNESYEIENINDSDDEKIDCSKDNQFHMRSLTLFEKPDENTIKLEFTDNASLS